MKIKSWQLFIISLVLHLGGVLAIGHYQNPRLWENGAIAQNLYEGSGFSASFSKDVEPTSWQAPGYPFLLVGFWQVFGQNSSAYLAISILQCLAIASMIWPIGWLSRRWFPEVPIWLVQVATILAPLYLWYPTRLHHTAILLGIQPWLLWAWLDWAGRKGIPSLGAGVLTALAAYFQPILLGIYGLLGLWRIATAFWKREWRSFSWLGVAGICVLLGILPWTIRNYQVHGKILLMKSSFGKELWMGNNPHATGTGYALGGKDEITNAYPPKAMVLHGQVSEMQLMDALKDEALDWIFNNPGDFLEISGKKILWFWTLPPRDRIRTTGDAEAVLFRGIYLTYWIFVVGLFVFGAIVGRAKKEMFLIIAVFIFYYSLIYGVTHVGQVRFRGEIEFIFFPAAAAAIYFLMTRRRENFLFSLG